MRAGGEGGFLEDALERVSQFTEQQEDLKSRTFGALAYPMFLGVVGTAVARAMARSIGARRKGQPATSRARARSAWVVRRDRLHASNFLN